MKEVIKIVYNGKDFRNVEKNSAGEEEKLLALAIHQEVENALMPLVPLVEEEGGEVTVNIKGPNMFEIGTTNISDDLKKKVVAALTPAR